MVEAKSTRILLEPEMFNPVFTLNDVTAVLPIATNPVVYPNYFTVAPNRQPLFYVRSKSAEAWVPYEFGVPRVNMPICRMQTNREVVIRNAVPVVSARA